MPDHQHFWTEVAIVVLLDCLMLVKDRKCHPCFFRADTLFDLRRTTIFTAVFMELP
jgi:hypothetical protein